MIYRLDNVCKKRKGGDAEFELRIPRFDISRGEFIAVVGPSGCGKSTLMDLLALVLRPDAASSGGDEMHFAFSPSDTDEVSIAEAWRRKDGKTLAALRKRHIGYVLQTGGLLPFLSVRSNIGLSCRLTGMADIPGHVEGIARSLGISDQLNKKPQFLSGGQRQRAAIARALVHRPALVLADEPTAAVDSEQAGNIVQEFRSRAKDQHTGVIMVSHDLNLVEKAEADRMFSFRTSKEKVEEMNVFISTMCEQ